MKDFPIFTTEYGVASLILKEVPYRQIAYIHLQDSQEPEKLLEECVSFCRICGAENIYATGHSFLECFPLHCAIWEMRGRAEGAEPASLFPVTEQTVSQWRQIYNEKMRSVDNAATLETRDEKRILESGGAYFIHENGKLLGIGWMEDNRLEAIASVKTGAGDRILCTLQTLLYEDPMTLEVASTNKKAIRLYEQMGLFRVGEKSKWYYVK